MDLLLNNARLVSMETGVQGYSVQSDVCIGVDKGVIAYIGDYLPELEHNAKEVINCRGYLVTPGLIDCHTHLIYAGNRAGEFEQRLKGVPYIEIAKQGGGILSTVTATRQASHEELLKSALPKLDALIECGVTSVEIKSGYGLTLEDEVKMLQVAKSLEQHRPIKIETTLLAAHAVPPEFADDADGYIDHICNDIIPYVAKHQLASSVDVFCESIGFNLQQTEKVFKSAIHHGLEIKGHTEQLSHLGGSALTAEYQGLSVDHIEYLDLAGVEALAESKTVATLLPGAFYFLRETQLPPIDALRTHQVPMAIATDLNPGTSPFADLNLMMNMSCTLFRLTPEEALRGVTQHAARALGYGNKRGQVRVGYEADLAIWNSPTPADLSYQVGSKRLVARIVDGVCHIHKEGSL